jgi:hypothetical protein
MIDIEKRIHSIEERLQSVEAELAIRNLISRYGLAVDCGDSAAAMACHTPKAVYIVTNPAAGRDDGTDSANLELRGCKAIGEMLESPTHQTLLPNCAHTVGPVTVEVNENTARATGYSRLYHTSDDQPQLIRLAINEWCFERLTGQWRINRRESRLTSDSEAQQLLRNAAFKV